MYSALLLEYIASHDGWWTQFNSTPPRTNQLRPHNDDPRPKAYNYTSINCYQVCVLGKLWIRSPVRWLWPTNSLEWEEIQNCTQDKTTKGWSRLCWRPRRPCTLCYQGSSLGNFIFYSRNRINWFGGSGDLEIVSLILTNPILHRGIPYLPYVVLWFPLPLCRFSITTKEANEHSQT